MFGSTYLKNDLLHANLIRGINLHLVCFLISPPQPLLNRPDCHDAITIQMMSQFMPSKGSRSVRGGGFGESDSIEGILILHPVRNFRQYQHVYRYSGKRSNSL